MPEESGRPRTLLSGHDGSYIIFDLETTGKVTSGDAADEIVEIGFIEVNCFGEEIFSWETTVKASKPSSPKAIEKHKLGRDALSSSPEFSEIGYWLASVMNGKMLVAHNLHKFDKVMLLNHFLRLPGLEVDLGHGIDTLPTPSKGMGLDDLRRMHSIHEPAHSAMGDARTILTLLGKEVLTPDAGSSPFRLVKSPHESPEMPAAVRRIDLFRSSKSQQQESSEKASFSMQPSGSIYLQPDDKVCLSGGEGAHRELLEAKHKELQLESKSIRSFSKRLAAIVVTDLYSTAAKPEKARANGIPFIKADDFLEVKAGQVVQTWKCVDH